MAIFFTQDNLILSLPLISVCVVYTYIKFIPLIVGIPLLGVFALLVHLYSKYRQYKVEKSLTEIVNEDVVKELTLEDDIKKNKEQNKKTKKDRKTNDKVRQRLKEEKKKNNSKQNKSNDDNVDNALDEDDALLMFAKGSRDKQKKK